MNTDLIADLISEKVRLEIYQKIKKLHQQKLRKLWDRQGQAHV
jgi:hypothetical protein